MTTGLSLGVTGATGAVGGRVARLLADAGVPTRLVVRDPSRAPALPEAEVEAAAYGDRTASVRALRGLRTVFMVSASESAARVDEHRAFVDAAIEAGVEHLVYLSFAGAAADATFTLARDHHATEEHVRASGTAWTFLRDNLYLDFLPMLGGEDGVLRGPAGDGRFAGLARADAADAAAAVLQAPEVHAGRTYTLTGPEALSLADAAARMSATLGRPFRYAEETVEEAYAARARYGAPDWQVDAWVSTYTAIAAGDLAAVTDDVRRLTGHAPRALEDVLRG